MRNGIQYSRREGEGNGKRREGLRRWGEKDGEQLSCFFVFSSFPPPLALGFFSGSLNVIGSRLKGRGYCR